MSPPSSAHLTYTQLLAAARAEQAALARTSALLAALRTALLLAAAGVVGAGLAGFLPRGGGWAAAVMAACYLVLAVLHHQVLRREAGAQLLVTLNERGLARLGGGWRSFPEKGERFLSSSHLYAQDLDIFGQGSLFQLLDETATRAGEERLAAWLSAPASLEEVLARQGAVRELVPLVRFRQELCVSARMAAREKADPGVFIRWAESGPWLSSIRWARPAAVVLPCVTLALFLLGLEEVAILPGWAVWVGLFAQLLAVGATRRALREMEAGLEAGERGFVRYAPLFETLERQRFEHPLLRRLQAGLQRPGEPPVSAHFRRFGFLYSLIELKRHQFYPLVHWLTLWGVHSLFAMERWREAYGARARAWFDALADLEALCCVAGFAQERPDFCWPELEARGPRVEAEALGHPLLEAPVLNDVSLLGPGHALLITGSNMSGKTTLMRALGVNLVLALAGAPVCARAFRLSPLRVLTSMRVKDSLERGLSYFHAEVQRLKAVLDAATAVQGQALFLLDEILLGTNTRERELASREVLRLLLSTGACGVVTTHDLALCALAQAPDSRVVNVHFRDQLDQGRMTFDYRLRPGVVDTSNALRVLRASGIPMPDGA